MKWWLPSFCTKGLKELCDAYSLARREYYFDRWLPIISFCILYVLYLYKDKFNTFANWIAEVSAELRLYLGFVPHWQAAPLPRGEWGNHPSVPPVKRQIMFTAIRRLLFINVINLPIVRFSVYACHLVAVVLNSIALYLYTHFKFRTTVINDLITNHASFG